MLERVRLETALDDDFERTIFSAELCRVADVGNFPFNIGWRTVNALQNRTCFVKATSGDEPARRVWHEQKPNELDNGWNGRQSKHVPVSNNRASKHHKLNWHS